MNTSPDHKPALIKPFITQQIYSFILYLHTHTHTDPETQTHTMVISCSPSATPMQDLSNTLAHTHTPTVCTRTSQSYRRQKITRDQLHLVRETEMTEEGDNCLNPIYTKKPQYLKKEVCYILCHLSHKQEILRFHVIFFPEGLLRCMCCAATNNKQRGTQGHCITMADTAWTYSFKKGGSRVQVKHALAQQAHSPFVFFSHQKHTRYSDHRRRAPFTQVFT